MNYRILATLALGGLLAGCLFTSPEQELRESLGDFEDGDEEHRPGQPCLVCHSSDYNPGGDVFAVAGTIYLRATDADGIEGAEVIIADDAGHQFTALTNRVGNFMVEVKGDLRQPRQKEDGRLQIPWKLEYPLRIEIRRGSLEQTLEQTMETYTWREGSCSSCHGATAGADSVGRVYLMDEAAP